MQTYFKRYRMEMLLRPRNEASGLPAGYRMLRWDAQLLEMHAEAKFRSFRNEMDANVFPCLGDREGCHRLMTEISEKQGFLPGATWLVMHNRGDGSIDFCGTVQGIRDRNGSGGIQNLGITPEHRGRGLGTCLLTQALGGFREAGLKRAFLEVTARNAAAVRLYRRVGFRHVKTVYKAVEVACT